MKRTLVWFLMLAAGLPGGGLAAGIERIWLTHASADPSQLVINWETAAAGESVVELGTDGKLDQRFGDDRPVTRHQVEVPIGQRDAVYAYRVRSGPEVSAVARFKSYPTRELRIAVVGNWGYAGDKDVRSILADDVHLLVTLGDNVPSLHQPGLAGTRAFAALVDAHRELFRGTPFLPILGNHDREIAPRGPKPPAQPVYDVEASAYREFFALPGEEWKWLFDVPEFDLRLMALDLSHIQDFGTTWQTCHAWQPDSAQFRWYAETLAATAQGFVVTLMNERQTQLQGLTKGAWHEHFRKGSALLTGFGYFADRALLEGGLPYYNTSLKGDGDLYRDPRSLFHAREDNYLLLRFTAGAPEATVQCKSLRGEVLETTRIRKRS